MKLNKIIGGIRVNDRLADIVTGLAEITESIFRRRFFIYKIGCFIKILRE